MDASADLRRLMGCLQSLDFESESLQTPPKQGCVGGMAMSGANLSTKCTYEKCDMFWRECVVD